MEFQTFLQAENKKLKEELNHKDTTIQHLNEHVAHVEEGEGVETELLNDLKAENLRLCQALKDGEQKIQVLKYEVTDNDPTVEHDIKDLKAVSTNKWFTLTEALVEWKQEWRQEMDALKGEGGSDQQRQNH